MVGRILTGLFATYADILSSKRSTSPHGLGFSAIGMLPYRAPGVNAGDTRDFGTILEPR